MVVAAVHQERSGRSATRVDDAIIGRAWEALAGVPDPEIPVISIVELGIVRAVRVKDATLVIDVTPTYSGCPATETIMTDIHDALVGRGIVDARIETRLAPAWSTDRIAPEAKRRLREFGIAPPHLAAPRIDVTGISPLRRIIAVACPRCASVRTRLVSQFGSTACKAHYRCDDCLEPFDYFKAL
jgi:ring-1,2-phenylacetyl-CoA epoxidase subunit PaaD